MSINKNYFLYIAFLLPFFATSVIMPNFLIIIFRLLSIMSFLGIFIKRINSRKKIDKIEILILLIMFWLITISIINKTLSIEILYLIYSWCAVCLVAYNSSDNRNIFIRSFGFLLNLFVILNIPFVIKNLGIDAYESVYIFGGKNTIQLFFIPAIFVNYSLSILDFGKLKLKYLFFIILDILTVVFAGASTGILTIIIFLLFYFTNKNIKVNFKIYAIVLVVGLLLIFNTQYIEKIDFMNNFIVNVLHKDLTFTSRTRIWDFAIPLVFKNFWGFGYGNSIIFNYTMRVNECHNMFLELLLIGGFPLLITYIMLVYTLLKNNPNKICNTLLVICFSFFIIGLTESVQFHEQFWIIMIFYYKYSSLNKNSLASKGE